MKMTFIALLAVALAIPATAQNKLKSDQTYSTANYKHPNKVTAAREWKPEASIEFRKKKRQPQTIATYREQQRRGGADDAAIAIPAGPSVANRNYKQQNLMVSQQPTTKPEVANRAEANDRAEN